MKNQRLCTPGQALLEYSMIGVLVAVVCVGGLQLLGDRVANAIAEPFRRMAGGPVAVTPPPASSGEESRPTTAPECGTEGYGSCGHGYF